MMRKGLLLYERIPEQVATINDGTGTLWTMKYTYNDFDSVATRTDARGVVTTYGYDTLRRPTTVTYNTTSAPGVAATPTVTYSYQQNKLQSVSVGSDYSESYTYDQYNRLDRDNTGDAGQAVHKRLPV